MRSRKEISNELLTDHHKHSDDTFKFDLDIAKIEILLDIRDQNETIISQLNSMKKYSATSVDESSSDNIKEHYDIPIHS